MSKLSYMTLREKAADEIRMKILTQEYPPGMKIVEQNLSNEFEISRGPIREALRQLEQEGLLEYSRNIGCSVKDVTIEDVYEIYLLRSTYEVLAVRSFQGKFTEKELAQMEDILNKMQDSGTTDIRQIIDHDHMLHQIIVEKSGMPRLIKSWKELDYGSSIAVRYGRPDRKEMNEHQYNIHHDLIQIFRMGYTEDICQAISDHYMLPVKKIMAEQGKKR